MPEVIRVIRARTKIQTQAAQSLFFTSQMYLSHIHVYEMEQEFLMEKVLDINALAKC